jgi:D-alanyl-D-alanine carboxypeptidase (penicillin-binding protein 5/6)
MDAATGQVLYNEHGYRQMDPASLTKMMTAYLVIRAGHLDRVVTVSRRAASTEGSRLHIREGQRYTVLDLLRGLLMRSGNDAATQLAEYEAGSVPAFADRMNQAARRLGAYNTHFVNPHGLTAPGHYTSAYDLAQIARAALKLPVFQHLVSTPTDWVDELSRHRRRVLSNTNPLLESFPAADGVKTGTTSAAGRCVVASATRDGTQLIAVILKSRDRFGDAARLLGWGFSTFQRRTVIRAGERLGAIRVTRGMRGTVPIVALRGVSVLAPAGERPTVTLATESALPAPVMRGRWVGLASTFLGGEPVGTVAVVAGDSVARAYSPRAWWDRLLGRIRRLFVSRRTAGTPS